MLGKKIIIIAGVLLALFTIRMAYLAKTSRDMPVKLGLEAGKLTNCPHKPNCVSSQEEGSHFVKPIASGLPMEDAKKRILQLPDSRIDREGESYVHFVFKSKFFGFVDDVELLRKDGTYHIRSASRVGYSDMDANKNRVKLIRKLLSDKNESKEERP